ncbi:hypothetical protein BRC19_03060 [Candidatus Saccharibacteria bacterium QS_5_54_17]|nr:MAG: hypothetical protein BRC19_03060 [Candidatus Saccharibacteria bacterium QS_5_54_17]
MIIGVAGGVLAVEYADSARSSSDVAQETPSSAQKDNLHLRPSSGSGGETRQKSLSPQPAAQQLQPASGEQVYKNYDSQSTDYPSGH